MSQLNIRPVFDVNADVQGRDLASAADAIDKVLDADRAACRPRAITVTLSGQVETMRESFNGLFPGMALGGGAGLSHSGHQFSELDRSADRAVRGAVHRSAASCGCCF